MEFKTLEEAEEYYWANLAKHNEDEDGLEIFLEGAIIAEQHELE